MRKATIVEADYAEFLKQLTIAKREKRCLEPIMDKDAWIEDTIKQDLKVTAFASIVSERYQAEEMFLILDGKEPWNGLFAIDRDTRACVRFVVVDV